MTRYPCNVNRLLLVSLLLLGACSRSPAPSAAPDAAAWRLPAYRNVDFYINEYNANGESGMHLTPDSDAWPKPGTTSGLTHLSAGGSTTSSDGAIYKVEVIYLGPDQDGDRYDVTITHPGANGSTDAEEFHSTFRGKEMELWRDKVCAIGIRLKESPPGEKEQTTVSGKQRELIKTGRRRSFTTA